MTAEPRTETAPETWGDPRSRTVTWHDPMITAAGALERSGLETMQAVSIELKVSYLRAVRATSGPLTAIGRVIKPGRRVAFAEGEVLDAAGRTVATASSSLLVFPLPAASFTTRTRDLPR